MMFALCGILSWIRWRHIVPETIRIAEFRITEYHISATSREEKFDNSGYVLRTEADSHADTTVARKNCVALNFTGRSCNVQPYSDTYESLKNIPIVTAATGYTSKNGLNYILVFPEALYMPHMKHSLFNPNQLRHFGTIVQDNSYAGDPMTITSRDWKFTACLETEGMDIYLTTWAPSNADLQACPHVTLASSEAWHPNSVKMPGLSNLEKEEIESRNVCGVQNMNNSLVDRQVRHEQSCNVVYNVNSLQEAINSLARVTHLDMEHKISLIKFKEALPPLPLPGPLEERDIQAPYTFLLSDRHLNTTPRTSVNDGDLV
jgi:hypothetical protein